VAVADVVDVLVPVLASEGLEAVGESEPLSSSLAMMPPITPSVAATLEGADAAADLYFSSVVFDPLGLYANISSQSLCERE
jgi:hypothetical protein